MARVPVLKSPNELTGDARDIAEQIVDTRKALDGPFSVWMHAPEWAERVAHLGTMVRWEGTLKLRKTIILISAAEKIPLAWNCSNAFRFATWFGVTGVPAGPGDAAPRPSIIISPPVFISGTCLKFFQAPPFYPGGETRVLESLLVTVIFNQ